MKSLRVQGLISHTISDVCTLRKKKQRVRANILVLIKLELTLDEQDGIFTGRSPTQDVILRAILVKTVVNLMTETIVDEAELPHDIVMIST